MTQDIRPESSRVLKPVSWKRLPRAPFPCGGMADGAHAPCALLYRSDITSMWLRCIHGINLDTTEPFNAGYWMVACTPVGTAQYQSDTLRYAYCFKFMIKSIRLKDMNLKACCLWFTSFIYDGIKKTAYNIRNPMPGIACNGGRYIPLRHW